MLDINENKKWRKIKCNMANYEGIFKLSNFIGTRMIELDDDNDVLELCLVIPIERNGLIVTKNNNVYCKMFINETQYDKGDSSTHYFRQKSNDNHRKKTSALGYDMPYLGTMKPSRFINRQFGNKFRFNQKVKNIDLD